MQLKFNKQLSKKLEIVIKKMARVATKILNTNNQHDK
jgi:hypothetical protein